MNTQFTNQERAEVLTAALPYIRRYTGKIVVVKYGGNAMVNEQLKQQVMEDIVLLWLIGVRIVLVHGGGPEISELMAKLGKKPEFVNGLRVTDQETMDIVQMVLAGKVNKTLVNLLEMKGGRAIGLSGMDGRLLECEIRDPALGINGDTAAAYIAGALNAERLIMMTDIAGVLRDKDDPSTLIPEITLQDIPKLQEEGIVTGGMIPKVQCCAEALSRGVRHVVIMDGRVPHSILMELLTDEGAGTMVSGDLA